MKFLMAFLLIGALPANATRTIYVNTYPHTCCGGVDYFLSVSNPCAVDQTLKVTVTGNDVDYLTNAFNLSCNGTTLCTAGPTTFSSGSSRAYSFRSRHPADVSKLPTMGILIKIEVTQNSGCLTASLHSRVNYNSGLIEDTVALVNGGKPF